MRKTQDELEPQVWDQGQKIESVLHGPGSEAAVEEAFAEHLLREGWVVRRQVGYVDVIATKEGQTLVAEVKGRTGANQGLDTDTMFGQILGRYPEQPDPQFHPAVVVPAESVHVVHRIPRWVLDRLGIEVYTVDENGRVFLVPARS